MLPRRESYKAKNWKWIRCKLFVSSQLDRLPLLKASIVRIWRASIWALLRFKWKLKKMRRTYRNKFDNDRMHWLDPERIQYCSLKEFNPYQYKGEIIGGGWDRLEKKFEDLDVYIAFKERFINGKDWVDTIFYRQVLDEVTDGKFLWGCRNKSELDRRCKNLDSLYQNIKNRGYKSQSEILSEKNIHDPMKIEDEITVNVGREGDLLFNNSAHRFSIAKLLGIQKVPVRITVRHPQWRDFREGVLRYAEEHDKKIYYPITHPDLQDIPSVHSDERFNIINANLSIKKGRLLDIGANWGYFCHKFEEMGFDCYAVESDRINIYILKKLKRAENANFKIIPQSIFEYKDIENLHFDVVLALNIFHHFLKKKDFYLKLINLLKTLKMKEMYFQPPLPNELQMEGAYKNYSEEEFVEFILQASRLNKAKLIGKDEDGRKIYKLYASDE